MIRTESQAVAAHDTVPWEGVSIVTGSRSLPGEVRPEEFVIHSSFPVFSATNASTDVSFFLSSSYNVKEDQPSLHHHQWRKILELESFSGAPSS